MAVLVTGGAGFIGSNIAHQLCRDGQDVIAIDNLNDYYDPILKKARIAHFLTQPNCRFIQMDIADRTAMEALRASHPDITHIVHLAAQAGVRYSLTNPHAYIEANIIGHLNILELARHLPNLVHLAYASSSSVYGGNQKIPFAVEDRVDAPISLYAATKRADELMSHTYSHLYGIAATGLRFFTVYGPWGRPDMAAYLFADAISKGQPIKIFNHGDMERDFTYIDDIVAGVLAILKNPPTAAEGAPHRVYNIGNNKPERLMDMVALIEKALGRKAEYHFTDMQPGDVQRTYADISAISRDVGYRPTTSIDVGIPRFINWYKSYHQTC